MFENKSNYLTIATNLLVFVIVIIFQTSGFINISIGRATPILFIPLITVYSVRSTIGQSAVAGFVLGACLDFVTVGSYCFNTILFFILGVGICVCSNNLFNKNLKAVSALCIIVSVVYYLLYFFVFHLLKYPVTDSIGYLVLYAIPSAVYSAVLVIPFYYLYNLLEKLGKD